MLSAPERESPRHDRSVHFERGVVWLLANPRAGRGHAVAMLSAVVRRLRHAGWDPRICTQHPAIALPEGEKPNACIVIGGDGTLRAAVARLLHEFGKEVPPVLPVPMGTANLMGQYLGQARPLWRIAAEGAWALASHWYDALPRRFIERQLGHRRLHTFRRAAGPILPDSRRLVRAVSAGVIVALESGKARLLDVGLANDSPFLLMSGVGFDAHIVGTLNTRRLQTTGPIGLMSYAMPAASAVAGYAFPPIRVEVDGHRLWGPRRGIVMVANVPQYGTGFPLVSDASAEDGLLDVLCLPCEGRSDLLKLFALAATGSHEAISGSATARGTTVMVDGEQRAQIPVQVDGDPAGTLPLHVTIWPAAVPFVSP